MAKKARGSSRSLTLSGLNLAIDKVVALAIVRFRGKNMYPVYFSRRLLLELGYKKRELFSAKKFKSIFEEGYKRIVETFSGNATQAKIPNVVMKRKVECNVIFEVSAKRVGDFGVLNFTDVTDSILDWTGAYSRTSFFHLGNIEFGRALREKNKVWVFMLDVDDLKPVNDVFGHVEGDLVLSDLVKSLKLSFRRTDLVGRVGGDEFAVIAIDGENFNPLERMYAVKNKFNKFVESRKEKTLSTYHVDVSVGYSSVDYKKQFRGGLADVLGWADEIMYTVKNSKKENKKKK